MVIENETGEEVRVQADLPNNQEVPSSLPITGDESVIRSNMTKVADYIVQMSGWARKFDELNAMKTDLERGLAEALERARQADLLKDEAEKKATKAEADAKMAREAYKVVDDERNAAVRIAHQQEEQITTLEAGLTLQVNENSKLAQALETEKGLLEVARTERDRFRDANVDLTAAMETTQREWQARYEEACRDRDQLQQERDAMKINLDRANTANSRLIEEITAQKNKVSNIRQLLN
jgi:chromosome segregation ATPase